MEQNRPSIGQQILFHVIGLAGMVGLALFLVDVNAIIANNKTLAWLQENPTKPNLEHLQVVQAEKSSLLTYLIVLGVATLILILGWHLLRRKMGYSFGGAFFYLLLYAVATFLILLLLVMITFPTDVPIGQG